MITIERLATQDGYWYALVFKKGGQIRFKTTVAFRQWFCASLSFWIACKGGDIYAGAWIGWNRYVRQKWTARYSRHHLGSRSRCCTATCPIGGIGAYYDFPIKHPRIRK